VFENRRLRIIGVVAGFRRQVFVILVNGRATKELLDRPLMVNDELHDLVNQRKVRIAQGLFLGQARAGPVRGACGDFNCDPTVLVVKTKLEVFPLKRLPGVVLKFKAHHQRNLPGRFAKRIHMDEQLGYERGHENLILAEHGSQDTFPWPATVVTAAGDHVQPCITGRFALNVHSILSLLDGRLEK
jgi:hypothetical protein